MTLKAMWEQKFGTTLWKQTSKDRGAIQFEFGHYKNISIGFTHTWNLKYDYNNQSVWRAKNTKRVRNREKKNHCSLYVFCLFIWKRTEGLQTNQFQPWWLCFVLHSHFCNPLNLKLLNWWNFYRYVYLFMNSYAKCFLVQMKVTNQDEEQAKYYKYLQQIHCQLNPNFLFRLKKTKNCQYLFKNLIKICKDFFFFIKVTEGGSWSCAAERTVALTFKFFHWKIFYAFGWKK